MTKSDGGGRARATEPRWIGRVVPTPGWYPGAGEEALVQHAPIALSPPKRRPGDHEEGRVRQLVRLLARLLDRTGLEGWRLVGAVAVTIGVLWLAAVVLGLYPEGTW